MAKNDKGGSVALLPQYIGTKLLRATPKTRGEYNEHRGWTPPEGEDQDVDGYLVVYADGYESWSPKDQFEDAYISVPDGTDAEQLLHIVRGKTLLLLGVEA